MCCLLSCTHKKMPEGELVSIEYTTKETMEGYVYEGRVKQDSTGGFVLRAMKQSYGPLFEKKIGTQEMQKFRQIIEEEKMYEYKDSYQPDMEVMDGWSWSFSASFSDGSFITSYGSNASPKGSGLGRVNIYMEELVQDGVQIEMSEENE